MRLNAILLASTAFVVPTMAMAQSTGTVDFEESTIIVTGAQTQAVAGIQAPDTSKARQVLTQETIARQNPGQTILDTINMIPGVVFTNNDAYGSAGGQLTIRGFSADRISLTFDGVPLNDSGNYAIYSNQQLDPELIEQVNVNLGSTDVDSPTAAASGSTVNYRTKVPDRDFGVMLVGSVGEDSFYRMFGKVETGELGPWGTRAFFAFSNTGNDNPYNNYGVIHKQQYNGRVYQPLGSNGDFVSLAGHYNQNRNNFFGSLPLRLDTTQSPTNSAPRIVGGGSANRFPRDNDERTYDINYPCQTDTPQSGVVDTVAAAPPAPTAGDRCGTEFDRRYNPSNTGNIRGSSRFTLTDALILTVDPSYQYVKANGGGTIIGREGFRTISGQPLTGFIGGQYYFGVDLNGDGDLLDTCNTTGASCSSSNFNGVTLISPSQTQTHRYGVIANLRWDINDFHSIRVGYTFDRARHRQTGEVGYVQRNGEPFDVFPVNDPILDATGVPMQKRNRLSYAILNQVSGEYRGLFFDEKLTATLGLRAPFFKRDLNNYCFTTSDSGFVDCFGSADDPRNAIYAGANPTLQGPQRRVLKYDDVLPNVGLVYDITPQVSVFGNYSKGLQVPGTDALYNSFFFAPDTASARPDPETTDNFDLGVRYRSGTVQAQLSGWYTKYKNRLASAYDPVTERNVYRNLGEVNKAGIDGSIAYQPIQELQLYAFASYLDSEIQDDIEAAGTPVPTAGKRESGAPEYTYGGTVRGFLGPVELGITAKRTGGRFIYDTNLPVMANGIEVYPAKTNAYWLVNLDARFSLSPLGPDWEKTYFQINVYNLTDELYVGNFTTSLTQGTSSPPFAQIGAPRTISGSLIIAF